MPWATFYPMVPLTLGGKTPGTECVNGMFKFVEGVSAVLVSAFLDLFYGVSWNFMESFGLLQKHADNGGTVSEYLFWQVAEANLWGFSPVSVFLDGQSLVRFGVPIYQIYRKSLCANSYLALITFLVLSVLYVYA